MLRFTRNDLFLLLALTCLALLSACGREPQLPRLNNGDVILAFGDSLTHGTGASRDSAYPAVLSRLIGHTVVNAGVPGETTAEGLVRLPEVLDEVRPRIVLLCLGGNDMLRRNTNNTEANLRQMVQAIKASGAGVVLIGVPQPALLSGPPDFYERLADEFGLPYEGEILDEVLRSPKLKADPIHANAEGYKVVAERLAELLKDAGAIK
ncbi:MAG: arylesterase [Pseudomonadota bacterium]